MNARILAVLTTLLLLLALACQKSDRDVSQLVDERVAEALARVPTITPQPTATPQAVSEDVVDTTDAAIESLLGRLEIAESELRAQNDAFQAFVGSVSEPQAETGPLGGSIVTTAVESTDPSGRCWQYRVVSDGTGNTFLVEWEVLGVSNALCHNPSSICAREVEIRTALPRSCAG